MRTRNLWPLGIIAAFVLFISGTVGLIVFAASQKTELVSEDYYEQELRYQQHLESLERANRLAAPVFVNFDATADRIEIRLPRQEPAPASGRIELYRPSAGGLDRHPDFKPDPTGRQFLDARELRSGLWRVRVTWMAGGQEFCVDRKIVVVRKS
jgi:hypothetical protein